MLKFPWRKDAELLAEAGDLLPKVYESEVIFLFGLQMREVTSEHLHITFRGNRSPDAILYRDDTDEVMNVEFEAVSSNFEVHGHSAEECDLIVCYKHDKKWDNPVHVYELESSKLYPPKHERESK